MKIQKLYYGKFKIPYTNYFCKTKLDRNTEKSEIFNNTNFSTLFFIVLLYALRLSQSITLFWEQKLVGIDWSLQCSPIIYLYTLLLAYCRENVKLMCYKWKKIDNFVSNCSRYMVQPIVLEVLMSYFEIYPSWKITIPRGTCPHGRGA